MNIKIYFNNHYLQLCNDEAGFAQDQHVKVYQQPQYTEKEIKTITEKLTSAGNDRSILLKCEDAEAVLTALKGKFIYIEAAGGLIERDGHYLFIRRHDLWDLPKGKLEPGETIEHCAVRECEEECGIKELKIIKSLAPSFHLYKYKDSYALKKSYWFYMQTSYNKVLKPQLEEHITEVKWFTKKEIVARVLPDTYYTIRDVVSSSLNL